MTSQAPAPAGNRGPIFFGSYVSVFIDLLGFKNRLQELEDEFHGCGHSDSLDQKIRSLRHAVDAFRNGVDEHFDIHEERFKQPPPQALRPEDKSLWDRRVPKRPIVNVFSDCISIALEVDPNRPMALFFGMLVLVQGCVSSSLSLLIDHGIPVRGGISVGLGLTTGEKEVVSTGLAKAYAAESKVAKVPRIVFDADVRELMQKVTDEPRLWMPGEREKLGDLLPKFFDFVHKDDDDVFFVDFLGPSLPRLVDSPQRLAVFDRRVDQRVAAGIEKFRDAPKELEKWSWIRDYAIGARARRTQVQGQE